MCKNLRAHNAFGQFKVENKNVSYEHEYAPCNWSVMLNRELYLSLWIGDECMDKFLLPFTYMDHNKLLLGTFGREQVESIVMGFWIHLCHTCVTPCTILKLPCPKFMLAFPRGKTLRSCTFVEMEMIKCTHHNRLTDDIQSISQTKHIQSGVL